MIYWIYERALIRNLHILPAIASCSPQKTRTPQPSFRSDAGCRTYGSVRPKKHGSRAPHIAGLRTLTTRHGRRVPRFFLNKSHGTIAPLSQQTGRDERRGTGWRMVAEGTSGRSGLRRIRRWHETAVPDPHRRDVWGYLPFRKPACPSPAWTSYDILLHRPSASFSLFHGGPKVAFPGVA